jgi:hypothetical protein
MLCSVCFERNNECYHSFIIDDHYYLSCQIEKDTIMEWAPTMMIILANLIPAKKKDMGIVAVCSDGCSCNLVPVHNVPAHANQPNVFTCGICDNYSKDGSVMSCTT